ncbi:MAG: glycosyltransferase family 2 protein, partial [Verrucomicrobiae bacterium]|nr:glycosyltransferase family 2 protein [Verrucomicrobiae bacterium]
MSPRPFAIIVPTKDRPQELRRFLRSIEQQPVKPDQLIVVDGSDRPIQSALSDFRHLGIEYIPVRPPGLVKQRHAGVAALQAEIEVFGFFDDDIVLEPGALPAIQEFWEGRWDQYGGFGMNIVNAADVTYRKHLWYLRFFKIRDDRFPGAILPSCRSVPYSPTDRN